jgi:hypothetical protein
MTGTPGKGRFVVMDEFCKGGMSSAPCYRADVWKAQAAMALFFRLLNMAVNNSGVPVL